MTSKEKLESEGWTCKERRDGYRCDTYGGIYAKYILTISNNHELCEETFYIDRKGSEEREKDKLAEAWEWIYKNLLDIRYKNLKESCDAFGRLGMEKERLIYVAILDAVAQKIIERETLEHNK